jgi:hypothetical protein
MKKTLVILCFVCIALAQWQQEDEIPLPKGLQVNDLALSSTGEFYLLSASSILKYDTKTKKPFLVQEIKNGTILAVHGDEVFVVDNTNRLYTIDIKAEGVSRSTSLMLDAPEDIIPVHADKQVGLIVKDLGKITFATDKMMIGSITTPAERVRIIPFGDYQDKTTPFFTLANNRISAWTGGTFTNPETYIQQITYSASHRIIDFAADSDGELYVLFSDSILWLDARGAYQSTIDIPTVSMNTQLLMNSAKNSIVLYDPVKKTLTLLSKMQHQPTGELISLGSNQPNPVDNYTEIGFTVREPLRLTITVYNLIGEPVKVISSGRYPKGTHRVTWNATDERGNLVPNGIYFYRLESNKGVAIKQLIVLR